MLLGGGDLEVMTSPIRELVVKSLYQSSFAYHSLIGLKRFLVCILVRLPARWFGAETEAKSTQLCIGIFVVVFCWRPGIALGKIRAHGEVCLCPQDES